MVDTESPCSDQQLSSNFEKGVRIELTIICFIERMAGIVVRRENVNRMTQLLQTKRSINYKTFGTP